MNYKRVQELRKRASAWDNIKQWTTENITEPLYYMGKGIQQDPGEFVKNIGRSTESTVYNFGRPIANEISSDIRRGLHRVADASNKVFGDNRVTRTMQNIADGADNLDASANKWIDQRDDEIARKIGLPEGEKASQYIKIPGTNISLGNASRNLSYALLAGNSAVKGVRAAAQMASSAATQAGLFGSGSLLPAYTAAQNTAGAAGQALAHGASLLETVKAGWGLQRANKQIGRWLSPLIHSN